MFSPKSGLKAKRELFSEVVPVSNACSSSHIGLMSGSLFGVTVQFGVLFRQ
jgi:hypothetical protein